MEIVLKTGFSQVTVGSFMKNSNLIKGAKLVQANHVKEVSEKFSVIPLNASAPKYTEVLCCKIQKLNNREILVLNIYKSPKVNQSEFLLYLKSAIAEIRQKFPSKEIYILGDLNINVMAPGTSALHLKTMMNAFRLRQLIRNPTRPSSGTVIDHIYTDTSSPILESKPTPVFSSDHLLVYCVRKIQREKHVPLVRESQSFRHMKEDNWKSLNEEIAAFDWDPLQHSSISSN